MAFDISQIPNFLLKYIDKSNQTSSKKIISNFGGRNWVFLNDAYHFFISPLLKVCYKIITVVSKLCFDLDDNDSDHLLDDKLTNPNFIPQKSSTYMSWKEKLRNKQNVIFKIPAQGNCLFYALYVALKILYTNKVKDSINPDLFSEDLSTAIFNQLLKKPADNLRKITTIYIKKLLNALQNDPEIMEILSKNYADLSKIDNAKSQKNARKYQNLLDHMKDTIDDHNLAMKSKIKECRGRHADNRARQIKNRNAIAKILPQIFTTNFKPVINELFVRIRTHFSISDRMRSNLKEITQYRENKIKCTLRGSFNPGEIPELLRYAKNFISKDLNYGGSVEIYALSTLFKVPIEVKPEHQSNHTVIFNGDLEGKRIQLLLDTKGQHFNLQITP